MALMEPSGTQIIKSGVVDNLFSLVMAVAKHARKITTNAIDQNIYASTDYNLLREKAVTLATDDVANRRVLVLEKQED